MKHIVGAVNLSNLYSKEIPEILNGVHVGFCKYYKPLLEFETVYIEFININDQHRRRGYATAMVKELQRFNYLKWDGRLSTDGRKWYNSLMERQIV